MSSAGPPRNLMIAAGGGGDALAAAVVGSLLAGSLVGVATYSWDRLIIDPLPGPRTVTDFTGLSARPGYYQVVASSTPRPPAGSTLPRLAADLNMPVILLDASQGAAGLRRQITAAARDLDATDVHIVDVGGDVLAQPGDAGLRSPLADALTVAAARHIAATVWIAGPGLDGELPEGTVLDRLPAKTDSHRLGAGAWRPFRHVLDWHPSEASGLLAAASYEARGLVEIRDAGIPVALTEQSSLCFGMSVRQVAAVNPLIDGLADTTTFMQAETTTRSLIGVCELDAERAKAQRSRNRAPVATDFNTALHWWRQRATKRGIRYVTYRRLAEALHQADVDMVRSRLATTATDTRLPIWDLRSDTSALA
jgi:hypothetical protein